MFAFRRSHRQLQLNMLNSVTFNVKLQFVPYKGLTLRAFLESPYNVHHMYFHCDQIPRSQDVLEKYGVLKGSFFKHVMGDITESL